MPWPSLKLTIDSWDLVILTLGLKQRLEQKQGYDLKRSPWDSEVESITQMKGKCSRDKINHSKLHYCIGDWVGNCVRNFDSLHYQKVLNLWDNIQVHANLVHVKWFLVMKNTTWWGFTFPKKNEIWKIMTIWKTNIKTIETSSNHVDVDL